MNNHIFFFYVGFFYLLWGGEVLMGQEKAPAAYTEEYYGTERGLPNRTVHGATLSNNSLLWVGTDGGLCLLDGYKVKVFDEFPQLFDGELKRNDQGMLMATFGKRRPDSVEIFNPTTYTASGVRLAGKGGGYFGGIAQVEGAPLYFARGSFVYAYVPGKGERVAHALPAKLMKDDRLVYADSIDYLLYSPTEARLYGVVGGGEFKFELPSAPTLIHRESSGNILVASEEGTFRILTESLTTTSVPGLPSGRIANVAYTDDSNNVLIGYLDPYHLTLQDLQLLHNDTLEDASWIMEIENRVIGISGRDFRESFRLETHGGLYLVYREQSEKLFHRYLYQEVGPGKFGDLMRGFTADDAGNVYVNKDSKMPYLFRVNAKTQKLDTLTMRDNEGRVSDQYGCGTNLINYRGDIFGHSCELEAGGEFRGHVYRFRPADGSWKRWELPDLHQVIRWITPGRTEEELMLLTEHKGNQREGRLYYFYPAQDSLVRVNSAGPVVNIAGYTKSAARDTARNCLWIGTDQAFYRFDLATETLRRFTFPDGGNTTISDILIRRNNDLLLGTFKRGVQVFDPVSGVFTTLGGLLNEGERPPDNKDFIELPSNDIAALRPARENGLLISTFKGLFFRGGSYNTSSIYTTDHGLPSDEFNTPSLFYADSLKRWFAGTINGFVSFQEDSIRDRISPFSPVLTSIRRVDAKLGYETIERLPALPAPERIFLKPSVLYFSLDFTIPDYSGGPDRRYQTFLEGFDLGWNASSSTPSIRYSRLEPGDYVFQLKAFDTEGRQSPDILAINITVLKPWYREVWFYVLCLLLFAGSIFGLMSMRLDRMRKKLEAERKVQSLELRSLRQQLSPHFISNALNAIREYVRREDADNPTRYLTDFSLLMRQFLESSRHRFTPVAKEMNMLRRYVGLEQLRFPDKFSAEFFVDPAIDPDMDEVPSLFLQPLVENAIEHGLRPLPGGGKLRISIELDPNDDDVLICKVSDNGVGRFIAQQNPRHPGHVSRATQILEERRAVLAHDDRVMLSVVTEDLRPELKHTGTVVTIRIEGDLR